MDHWKSRYNVRRFLEDKIPDTSDIDALSNIIKFIPSQDSKIDHFWFILSPEHREFKAWLIENVFYYAKGDQDNAEYDEDMIQLLTAPYVFLCVNTMITEHHQLNARRNSGIILGALLAESLRMGYDTSVVGCTRGMNARDDRIEKCEMFTQKLYETFGEVKLSLLDKYRDSDRVVPHVALCIGQGMPLQERSIQKYEKYNYDIGQKPKKPIGNIIR